MAHGSMLGMRISRQSKYLSPDPGGPCRVPSISRISALGMAGRVLSWWRLRNRNRNKEADRGGHVRHWLAREVRGIFLATWQYLSSANKNEMRQYRISSQCLGAHWRRNVMPNSAAVSASQIFSASMSKTIVRKCPISVEILSARYLRNIDSDIRDKRPGRHHESDEAASEA